MRIRTIFVTLALVGVAVAGAYYGHLVLEARTAAPTVRGIYQCAMHPQIVSDQPGTCPICGMKLERVDDPALAARRQAGAGTRGAPLFYRHPMRPDVTSPVPAKDEMGMDYVPVYEADVAGTSDVPGHAAFTLSAARQQLIGVTRARVERRRLDGEIRAVGVVAYDPALYQAIVEYREALEARRQLGESAMSEARRGADAIVRAAVLRLRQLGIADQQLPAIAAAEQGPANLLLPGKTAW